MYLTLLSIKLVEALSSCQPRKRRIIPVGLSSASLGAESGQWSYHPPPLHYKQGSPPCIPIACESCGLLLHRLSPKKMCQPGRDCCASARRSIPRVSMHIDVLLVGSMHSVNLSRHPSQPESRCWRRKRGAKEVKCREHGGFVTSGINLTPTLT